MNPIEHVLVSYAYTLPSLILGFAVVYFTYVKSAKFPQKHVLTGLLITWSIFALLVFLFGEDLFRGIVFLLIPVIIGYPVFYLLHKKIQKQNQSSS